MLLSAVKIFNCVDECFLTQHVSDPTRENSTLDLVFSREPELVSDVQVIENLGNSDHNMLTFQVHHQQRVINSMRPRRDYHCGDDQSIKEQLKTVDWEDVMSGDMCTSWDNFKGILLDVEERFIPLKRKCESKRCKPVWMSNKALKSVGRSTRFSRGTRIKTIQLFKQQTTKQQEKLNQQNINSKGSSPTISSRTIIIY